MFSLNNQYHIQYNIINEFGCCENEVTILFLGMLIGTWDKRGWIIVEIKENL